VFGTPDIDYRRLASAGKGESHADIVKACLDALKDAIMEGQKSVGEASVILHLEERAQGHDLHR
jgi:AAA+ superfamily predicted ATPase